ncbi:uncharacterized protein I303_103541 [Kwoniella dejecticola CBS 10117]|uniref:Nuclear pore complex protein Nup85 n=1 Tax=Kwoniella dejecticola CBS 10117 TaxID=1296121 RepID=A0A1A6A716_9TREE|nr:nuclear pore complex protein Nup85 [Kwoniella dejecticola CBS 10117]OBR85849.1 nuclear pore complex protein Nup85 [Kwoniella dejecticola CBS 10117]
MAPAAAGFSFAPSSNSPFSFAPQGQPQPVPSTFSFGNPSPSSSALPPDATPSSSTKKSVINMEYSSHIEDDIEVLHSQPYAYKRSDRRKWQSTGRTLATVPSPVGGELASWITKKPPTNPNEPAKLSDTSRAIPDKTIYFTVLNWLPESLVQLYTESHLLFTSLQQIVAESHNRRLPSVGLDKVAEAWDRRGNLLGVDKLVGPPDAETVMHMRRLADLYLDQLGDLKGKQDVDVELRARFTTSYNILNLAEVLYLPTDGKGEGLVGEEILDWVNDVDPAPDNSQGNEIMSTKDPWDHPSFFPYISRCILRGFQLPAASFLRSLSHHPHPPISTLASLLAQHLSVFPRSTEERWRVDLDFLRAHKLWLAKFRAELVNFTGGKAKGKWFGDDNKYQNMESDFRTIIELMEGKPARILEEASDWKEALGAWGILVDVDIRRDHLPEIMGMILDKIPVDSTIPEDSIQSALCSADIIKALMGCYDIDIWLSAHLGDLLDKLELIPDDEQRFEIPLRDHFLLEYTESLQNQPKYSAFWRVICDYLNSAGAEGRNRLRTHIMRISINLDGESSKGKKKQADEGMEVEVEQAEAEDEAEQAKTKQLQEAVRLLDEVRAACGEFHLEEEFKIISGILASKLIRKGEYGMAASMCMMASDGWALSRIAEIILDTYITDGDDEFLRLVDTLPPSLLSEAPTALAELQTQLDPASGLPALPATSALSIFASRLTFLSEFRDYLLFLNQGARDRAASKLVGLLTSGIAPVGVWAVLLVESIDLLEDTDILFSSNETFELLRVLEEVKSNALFASTEYLGGLFVYLHRSDLKDQSDAEDKEDEVVKYDEAWKKLDQVRLALARNLARSLVNGFDGPF